jgi:hypothetical protein
MAAWFLRGIRRGVVTTRYPAEPEPSARVLPTPPAFDPRRLTDALADAVVDACPSGALTRDGAFLVLDIGACSACGRCIAAGGGAARQSGLFELAATERAHLVKRIPVTGDQR